MQIPQKMRAVNFTAIEVNCLIEEFTKRRKILTSKENTVDINLKKKACWGKITAVINTLDQGVVRTTAQVRKKWRDLLSTARKDYKAVKNTPIGVLPSAYSSPYSQVIIDILNSVSTSNEMDDVDDDSMLCVLLNDEDTVQSSPAEASGDCMDNNNASAELLQIQRERLHLEREKLNFMKEKWQIKKKLVEATLELMNLKKQKLELEIQQLKQNV